MRWTGGKEIEIIMDNDFVGRGERALGEDGQPSQHISTG